MHNLIKKGLAYTFLGKMGNIIIMLVLDTVLSRLLSPFVYGVVAILTVFIVFFQLLADIGLGPAIIQNQFLNQRDINVLFNFSVYSSSLLAICFGLLGLPLEKIYHIDDLAKYSLLLSIAVFFYGAILVPNAILAKKKEFKILSVNSLIGSAIGGIIGILLALNGGGVYSLLFNTIAASGIVFFLNLRKSKLVFTGYLKISSLQKVFSFTMNQLGFNILNYFSRNLDELLIGKYLSPSDLGNYNKSYRLLMYPATILGSIINPVLLPIMSDYQNDISMIRKTYVRMQGIFSDFVFPLSIFLSFSAKSIITLMYGNQWTEAIVPFAILALSVWAQVLNISAGTIFQVRNMTSKLLLTGIISSGIIITAIISGILQRSILSISLYLTIAFIINTVVVLQMVMKNAFNSSIVPLLKKMYIPLIVSLCMAVIFEIYSQIFQVNNLLIDIIFRFVVLCIAVVISSILNDNFNYLKKFIVKKEI